MMQQSQFCTQDHASGKPTVNKSVALDVTIVDSVEAFEGLRHGWEQLVKKTPSNCVFLTWEWLYTWWKWYGHSGSLFILLFKDSDGVLRGIAPLMLKRICGVFHRLQFIGSMSNVCSDFLDVISEMAWEKPIAKSMISFLLSRRLCWHALLLSSIRRDSHFFLAFQQVAKLRRLRSHQKVESVALFLPLPDTWPELVARFSFKIRKNIRYNRNRIQKAFSVSFASWDSLYDEYETIGLMKRLHEKSISRKGLSGVFSDETFTCFHSEVMGLFQQHGWLYIMFLLFDGKPVGFWYAYLYGGRCFNYQLGFDTDYRRYSIGTVMHSYVLEDAIQRGLNTFEYLRGGQQYKHHYTKSGMDMLQLCIFNNCWCSEVFRAVMSVSLRIKSVVIRILGRNLKRRVVSFVRGLNGGRL